MKFYFQKNGQMLGEPFEAATHEEALAQLEELHPNPIDKVVLRDWQHYQVTKDNVKEISAYSRMARMKL